MKIRSHLAFTLVLLLTAAMRCDATLVTVNFTSGDQTVTNLNGTTLLTGGNSAINGDGAVLQLGYFNSGTSATPFVGTWVALTGEGGANSVFSTGTGKTSIGDDFNAGAGNGTFAMGLSFNTSIAGTANSLPSAGTPLGIRIFNNTTIASSTRYETISSTLTTWQWQAPNDPPNNPVVNISLNDTLSSLRRENGTAAGAAATLTFNTNLPITSVPEASTFAFGVLVALAAAGTRRRGCGLSPAIRNHSAAVSDTKF